MKKLIFLVSCSIFLFSCGSGNVESEVNTDLTSSISQPVDVNDITYDPTSTVEVFIKRLGNQEFSRAYELQAVKKWGSLDEFSSKNNFGGISSTEIKTIKQNPNEGDKSVVYVEALYNDKYNGNSTFKQKFYLKQFGENWKIVDMKVVKSDESDSNEPLQIAGEYSCRIGDYQRKSLSLEIIGRDEYEMSLVVGEISGCSGELSGILHVSNNKAVYSDANFDCRGLTFSFSKDKVIISDNNRTCPVGANCDFNGTYTK